MYCHAGDKKTLKGTFDPTYIGLVYERSSDKNFMIYHGGLEELYNFIKNCKKRFFAIPHIWNILIVVLILIF